MGGRIEAEPMTPRERSEILLPGERERPSRRRLAIAYLLATLGPPAVALALVPLRADHIAVVAMVLIAPVVIVSLFGVVGAALLASLGAGASFAVVHTQPYWVPKVDNADDLVTTATLLFVGATIVWLCTSAERQRSRAGRRHDELHHLVGFVRSLTAGPGIADGSDAEDDPDPAQAAATHLVALLGLSTCVWRAGAAERSVPQLLDTGAVMGRLSSLNIDRSKMPTEFDIPAWSGNLRLGHFEATADGQQMVSAEERMTAATIVELFASHQAQRRANRLAPGPKPLPADAAAR